MNLDLDGKKAVITGGSRGIGLGIARVLCGEGADCLICGRDEAALKAAADETGSRTVPADVTRDAGILALADAVDQQMDGMIDILVCNVGSGRSVPPGMETAAEWRRMFEINLFSATSAIEVLLSRMSTGGAIACVSSIAGGSVIGAPVAYAAAKQALNTMIANTAAPMAEKGIRIFGVAPGNINFSGSVWDTRSSDDPEIVQALLDREVPLKRFGTPEEIGNFVAFLASPRAAFITGSVHVIDGGQSKST
jgi:3-oxoacyl-[acyl-carrier protein] reductase